jgi:hypothetical protein
LKLRLVLKTKTKKNKDITLKFNIAPKKHIGFINFINLAISQDQPISLSFEKISKSGQREESKIHGEFKFVGRDSGRLQQIEEEVHEREKKRKKQQEKRKHK